jgi:ubiquinone/menaquinone biosynthesis C-methylase UbiE
MFGIFEKKHGDYNELESARNYIKYVQSFDGQIERDVISRAVFNYLPREKESYILDAACGTGWLSKLIAEKYEKVLGFDFSKPLLNYAKKNIPSNCTFLAADITKEIPILEKQYDSAVVSLAITDIKNPQEAYLKLVEVLKDNGRLIIVIANPFYSFPVGIWKRTILGKFFGGKTNLLLRPYNNFERAKKEFNWKGNIPSYFHTFSEIINPALSSGLELEKIEELKIDKGKGSQGRKRQLYLYPMLMLLVFRKKGK